VLALIMFLLAAGLALVAVGVLLPGLFLLSLLGLALFGGTALIGMAAHHPGRPHVRH
jgi:hypothetical protein